MSEMAERVRDNIMLNVHKVGTGAMDWDDVARCVIGVMREPTDSMIRAGECEIFEHRASADDWALQATKEGWQAMIDEALK
jgi:hypothetical protein